MTCALSFRFVNNTAFKRQVFLTPDVKALITFQPLSNCGQEHLERGSYVE